MTLFFEQEDNTKAEAKAKAKAKTEVLTLKGFMIAGFKFISKL